MRNGTRGFFAALSCRMLAIAAPLALASSCALLPVDSGSAGAASSWGITPFEPSSITLGEFTPGADVAPEGQLEAYAALYGIKNGRYRWNAGYVRSKGRRVAVQTFIPLGDDSQPLPVKGTVVFAHGFLQHSGIVFRHLEFLLTEGYALVLVDLPGHGLSEGISGDIDDFSSYAQALRATRDAVLDDFPRPWIAMGHSTGCAAWLEYHIQTPGIFDRFVFLAPLVRIFPWEAARAGDFLFGKSISWLPRADPDKPEDPEFRAELENDPFLPKLFPYRWSRALFRWHDTLAFRAITDADIRIFQGEADGIVEFRWNMEFYRERVPSVRITMLPGIGHEVLFDVRDRLPAIQGLIVEALASPFGGGSAR